jgi:dsDNA-specific endonuclease/ATPase MutS2
LEPSLIERAKSLSGSQNREFTELLRKMQEEKKALARESYEKAQKRHWSPVGELDTRSASLDEELKARKQKFLKEVQMELIWRQKRYQREFTDLKDLDKAQRKSLPRRNSRKPNPSSEASATRSWKQPKPDAKPPLIPNREIGSGWPTLNPTPSFWNAGTDRCWWI